MEIRLFAAEVRMIRNNMKSFFIFNILAVSLTSPSVHPQSGGSYQIERSVISSGGQQSSAGQYTVNGTKGQAVVAPSAFGGVYTVESGFWFEDLGPTAAMTSISGRVADELGQGVAGATMTLTSADGQIYRVRTSSLGFFRFDDIEAGRTYTLTFQRKGMRFLQPSILIVLNEEVIGLEILAIRD